MPISKQIKSLGIELECGTKIPNSQLSILASDELEDYFNLTLKSDGSVGVYGDDIVNTCMEATFHSDKINEINTFLKIMYEDAKAKTNSSCGFHVHVKFKDQKKWTALFSNQVFQTIFYREYLKHFKNLYPETSKYKDRLQNGFCKRAYNEYDMKNIITYIEGLRSGSSASRYKGINLLSIKKHGTIEFRIFPYQENLEEAMKTIVWLIETLDKMPIKSHVAKKDIDTDTMLRAVNKVIDTTIDLNTTIIQKLFTKECNEEIVKEINIKPQTFGVVRACAD
jgi:hypothetical protein